MGKRILVVDDDLDQRESICMVLQEGGYVIDEAGNGAEAFNVLHSQKQRPDLILLDMMMPVMDGMAFLAGLRQSELQAIPVILMTAADDKVVRISSAARRLTEVIPEDRLMKPLDCRTLLEAVSAVLARTAPG